MKPSSKPSSFPVSSSSSSNMYTHNSYVYTFPSQEKAAAVTVLESQHTSRQLPRSPSSIAWVARTTYDMKTNGQGTEDLPSNKLRSSNSPKLGHPGQTLQTSKTNSPDGEERVSSLCNFVGLFVGKSCEDAIQPVAR